jgi:hypothetical protein
VLVALGHGDYAHAYVDDSAQSGLPVDVGRIDDEALDELLASGGKPNPKVAEIDLFRLTPPSPTDPDTLRTRLDAEVSTQQDLAKAGRLWFGIGEGLGALLVRMLVSERLHLPGVDRMKDALVYAVNDPCDRTYCSEFACKVLKAVDIHIKPTDDGLVQLGSIGDGSARRMHPIRALADGLLTVAPMDRHHRQLVEDFLATACQAYDKPPTDPRPFDADNFVMPQDFAGDGRFQRVATRKPTQTTWTSVTGRR